VHPELVYSVPQELPELLVQVLLALPELPV